VDDLKAITPPVCSLRPLFAVDVIFVVGVWDGRREGTVSDCHVILALIFLEYGFRTFFDRDHEEHIANGYLTCN
jgi:hypothetical protein